MPDSSAYDGPQGPLQHRCASCAATRPDLLRCTGCRVVRYCSRAHQAAHRAEHKSLCKKMAKLRAKLEHEDHAVRHATQDFMTPANAFETHAGHFWGLLHTRGYMRARFAVADEARLACTLDGLTEALEHFWDMLRLCRSDNMGIRDHVPSLLLRLDRDQECYDFVKWWETVGQEDDYDWSDTDLRFLDVRDADVMEEPKFLLHRFGNLGFLVSILLLKIKMLLDIRHIKVIRKVLIGRLPIELWREVESSAVRSPFSARRFVGRPYGDLTKAEDTLLKQCRDIGHAVFEANEYFTGELLCLTDETMSYRPGAYSHGSCEQMVLVMHEVYPAWHETAGALELLQSAHACAVRAYRVELVKEVVIDKIWEFLHVAAQDGSYLGSANEKPSEKYAVEFRKQGLHHNLHEPQGVDEDDGEDWYDDGMGGNPFECDCFDHGFHQHGSSSDPLYEEYLRDVGAIF
ncbi:hypothetical protein PG993_013711 [Apiospora rasikravindrae]|uniref:MYND-type domain-containing protein n=1 Tax=Apiospora rasikravindrae TaxID=990691 RepID=A0ABR1RQZ8_9PEZI